MRRQKRLLAWELDDNVYITAGRGENPRLSLRGPGEGRTSLPWVPASLSVQPIDERMTLESLPQLEGLMHLSKPTACGCCGPSLRAQTPH